MTTHNKKQFGVWMDTREATIIGNQAPDNNEMVVLGHVTNNGADNNSNENAANNQQQALAHKFFKEIAAIMPNVDELHVTGTGQVQEQFIHFLAATPQYKNAKCTESTSNKMGNEQLVAYIGKYFKG